MRPAEPQVDWRDVPADPDLHGDLGYEFVNLEMIDLDAPNQVMVLPEEAEMLREDAFAVVDGDDVCDLREWA